MNTICMLYDDRNTVEELLQREGLSRDIPYLVMIYTSSLGKEAAVDLASRLKAYLPVSHVIGSSASGVIYKGQQLPEGTLIMLQQYESSDIYTASFSWEGKSAGETADMIASALEEKNAGFMHILCGDHYSDVHNFMEEFGKRNGKIKMAGGIAGDILSDNTVGFVFTPEGIVKQGIVIAALCGGKTKVYQGINIAHEPISPRYTFNQGEKSFWNQVNGEDAEEWVQKQFGIDAIKEYEDWQMIAANDTMVRFPIILEGHHGASRFLKYDGEHKKISQYFSNIPEGTEFRIGYVNPTECVKETFRICNELRYHPVETLFCYSCLFRRLYLHNCAEWELSPYKEADLCGAFMMGEIGCLEGKNEFLNGSCVLVGIAEKDVHIRPDFDVFVSLNSIQDDTKDLLNFVLKKQSENVNRHNEELLNQLLERQMEGKTQMLIDINTGVGNYMKFIEDGRQFSFNKLCMVRIENADLLARHMGPEAGRKITGEAICQVRDYMENMSPKEHPLLFFYVFSDDSFFVTADERISESRFIAICRGMFNQFQVIKVEDAKELVLTRFVLVVDEKELLESALNGFEAGKNTQTPFMICGKDKSARCSTEEEFKMIGVLIRALEQDGIVPYIQGIYDNVEKRLTRYEALMRIIDWDGTIYPPAQFMDIAKKYHLYIHLSQIMMDKVFTRFAHKEEVVGINFSAFDINSYEMQEMIFSKLEKIKDASNFVIEILEDEPFEDMTVLGAFVERVRTYGVKIAIDDFGTGYSNLMEIASIAPDYIKIDGEIIRNLPTSSVSRKLLDVIIYMGKLFQAEIVAEYVEDESIQAMIEEKQIRYSQGFHFSKPGPYVSR